jgi:hypothetical protein
LLSPDARRASQLKGICVEASRKSTGNSRSSLLRSISGLLAVIVPLIPRSEEASMRLSAERRMKSASM